MDEKTRAALVKGGVIDITTHGRKSGEDRRIEIAFMNFDGKIYISGFPRPEKRGWLANLETDPQFTFHLKSATNSGSSNVAGFDADLRARARSITDEAERRVVLSRVIATWTANGAATQ